MTTPLLIDTDPGVDDALAILMAFAEPAVEIVGLTVAAGNVGLEHTVRNALRLVETVDRDVPVHPGCPAPILPPPASAAFVHGEDGFGDAGLPEPARRASTVHAVDAILDASRRHAGDLTLVCLGPLTNLAVALLIDPTLPSRVPRLVVMGGAVDGRGNTERIKAEFNIGFDPEAADVVFRRWPRFELVDWEATLAHAIPFERLEGWLAAPTPAARLMRAIAEKRHAWVRAHRSATHSHLADALAMAVVLEPALVAEAADRHVSVALVGEHTRGMTVVDWAGRTGLAANAWIARRIDQAGFERRIEGALIGR
jgi:purine nucleosidase